MMTKNAAINNSYRPAIEINHSQQILGNPETNLPVYLKDSLQKYQHFIEEQKKNIEQLTSLKLHMETTGKVCPKAWHWGRFYKLFHPMHESYWLTTWWETTDEEKQRRFDEQLNYLARQTIRFREAYTFLMEIDDRNWYFDNQTPPI